MKYQNNLPALSASPLNRRVFVSKALATLAGAAATVMPPPPASRQAFAQAGGRQGNAAADPASVTAKLFPGFREMKIATSGAVINVVTGGSGPPLLVMHGYPQTHVEWHRMARDLAQRFTVVLADLRGYGDSSKPPEDENHAGYSKRAMALDKVEVMEKLGFRQFSVVGHDRGGRVAHRLALDHPDRVQKLVVLDIVPTLRMFETIDKNSAIAGFHWYFLAQPAPFPETMINANVEVWLARSGQKSAFIAPEAYSEYLRCMSNPATVHAMCEDYRANATIDLEHDAADRGRKIACPFMVLWGEKGGLPRFDVLAEWRNFAADVRGKALAGTHWLAEQLPAQTLAEIVPFLTG
jgi:haloacetate dehalogenase